jgi:CHAD domain-containing protein
MPMLCSVALRISGLRKIELVENREQKLPSLILTKPWVINRRARQLLTELYRLAAIEEPAPGDIHKIRVHIKKLRSWLKLVESVSGDNLSSSDHRLRYLAACYSAARDSQVMLTTLSRLEATSPDTVLASNWREIMQCVPRQLKPACDAPEIMEIIGRLSRDFPDLPVTGATTIHQALVNSARLVDKKLLCRKVCNGNQKALHDLRKRIKRLDNQLLLAGSDNNKGISSRHGLLAKVSGALGDLHDLEVLRLWLAGHAGAAKPGPGDTLRMLEQLLETETEAALNLASRFLGSGVINSLT